MSDNIEIIPALMPRSFGELRELVEKFIGIVPIVQLDVMDGIFVPEKSWPYTEEEDALLPFVEGEEEFPFSHEISHEVDLMIAYPEREIIRWMCVGAARIIFHIESVTSERAHEIIEIIHSNNTHYLTGDDSRFIREVELGVAIDIATDNKTIESLMPHIDFIQCMGIAKIGYQGQPFDERVIQKIQDLREQYPEATISVDGGVNFESAPQLIAAGATRLVSGSTILQSDNLEETIEQLKQIA